MDKPISVSKISTNSASKNFLTQRSLPKREFLISKEFITGKSDFSLDLDLSLSEEFSMSSKEIGNKELKLIENLEALDASLIPDDSDSVSVIKELHQEDKLESRKEEIQRKSMTLDTSQYKSKWLCYNCIPSDKQKQTCVIL